MTGQVFPGVEQGPGAAARLAAEALRTVNHLTLMSPSSGTPGWEDIGDLYRVLGELGVVVERLPQAIDQLARHLQSPAMRARCRSDSGTTLTQTALLASATDDLVGAGGLIRALAPRLDSARTAVAHLAPINEQPLQSADSDGCWRSRANMESEPSEEPGS